jgi:competence protein ComEA
MQKFFSTLLLAGAMLVAQLASALPDDTAMVNVNTDDAATIAEVLDGIGLAKAEAIVRYREANGAFADVYELVNVKGVGEKTVLANAERIEVD